MNLEFTFGQGTEMGKLSAYTIYRHESVKIKTKKSSGWALRKCNT